MSQGLYRWFDKNGYLLYVGISRSLHSRVKQHEKTADWITEASFMTVDWFVTRTEVERAEKNAIQLENPLHNKAYKTDSDLVTRVTPPDKSQELSMLLMHKSQELSMLLMQIERYRIQHYRQELLESSYLKDLSVWRELYESQKNKPIERIFVA
jgi:excinuclease UvrABC nuclease subunit